MIEYSREMLEEVIRVIGKSGWDLVIEDGDMWVDLHKEFREEGEIVIGLEVIDWDYELDLEIDGEETYEEYYEMQDEDGKSEIIGNVWTVLTNEYSWCIETIRDMLEDEDY